MSVGILNPLYYAVSWILVEFHALFSLIFPPTSGWAWGLSIVGLVVVIRIALIPLFVRQIKAQRGLQVLQPQIKEIQKRYKDDRQKQQEELMKLYRETGTNPFASCLPIIAQAPIFFALFHVLNAGVRQGLAVGAMTPALAYQAGQATIFGAPLDATFLDPASGNPLNVKIVTSVMIVLMSATTFLTQRQLMVKNQATGQSNPMAQQMKVLLYVYPFMFAVFGINFPVGVLLYWLTTNLWSMGQQFYVIRRNPVPGSPAWDDLQRRNAERDAEKLARERGERLAADGTDGATGSATDQVTKPSNQRPQPKRQSRSKRKPAPRQPSGDQSNAATDANKDAPGVPDSRDDSTELKGKDGT